MSPLLIKFVASLVCQVMTILLPALVPPSAETGLATRSASLADLLPDSTIVAVEVRNLDKRWPEIRAVPAIARFQDQLLQNSENGAEELRTLAANRAVLALVTDEEQRSVFPLALLRPERFGEAVASLEGRGFQDSDGNPLLSVRREKNALWVAPVFAAERLAALARGNGPSMSLDLPTVGSGRSSTSPKLVEGWLNTSRLHELLLNQVEGSLPPPLELARSLAAAELEVMRYARFSRDLTADGVVTDAVLGYDMAALPAEVARALVAPSIPLVLPAELPQGVVIASAFRPEPAAVLAWLRHVASGDSRGPLRNLDFWIDEFEERSGIDLETDLLDQLGLRGWFFVLEGKTDATVQLLSVFEINDPDQLERSLVELTAWSFKQMRGRTLGFTAPQLSETELSGQRAHVTRVRTVLGELPGPAFMVTERHLLLGSGPDAVSAGLKLISAKDTWNDPSSHAGCAQQATELFRMQGSGFTPLIDALILLEDVESSPLVAALQELAYGLDAVSLSFRFEKDTAHIQSRISFE